MTAANTPSWRRKLVTYFTIFASLMVASLAFTPYPDIMIVWTGFLGLVFILILVRVTPRAPTENSFAIIPALAFSGSYLYRNMWGIPESVPLSALYVAVFLVSLAMFVYFVRRNVRESA